MAHLTRSPRLSVALLVLAVVAGACGGSEPAADDASPSPDASTASEAEPQTDDAPEPAAEPEAPVDDAPDAGDETESADAPDEEEEPAGPRLVETPLGTFEVPADPQRIVVTDVLGVLPMVLDLGVEVFGTWDAAATGTPSRTLLTQEEWDALEIVGSGIVPNVELLAAAEPDLVIHPPITDDDVDLISPFSAIVPIQSTLSWKDDARVVADAVDRIDEFERLIADYDAEAAALAARIDEELGDPTVAVLRVRPDSMRVHTNLHFSGNLLDDMGLRVPPDFAFEPASERNESTLLVPLSPEQVGVLADADYIFLMPVGTFVQPQDEVDAALAELQNGALWQTLPAVQEGRVTVVGAHWFVGSLRAAHQALDDVEAFFFG